MEISKINTIIEDIVKQYLSPKDSERRKIQWEYEKIDRFLPWKTFKTWSYARYTATTPVHDLDIIYENENKLLIGDMIRQLYELLCKYYPKDLLKEQDHSVKISIPGETFSVDVTPAIKTNENNWDWEKLYLISELEFKEQWRKYYKIEDGFIKTDPKWYISDATKIDSFDYTNWKFRKVVKFLKKWKHLNKEKNDNFKLKSFHIEQIVFQIFENNPKLGIYEALLQFLMQLEEKIQNASIVDRAYKNSTKDRFIDEYVNDLSISQRDTILKERNSLLNLIKKLPTMLNEGDVKSNLEYVLWIRSIKWPQKTITIDPISKPYF